MRQIGDSRIIKVKKDALLAKIVENKEKHIKEYEQAVLDYREEATKQLKEQTDALAAGNLEIKLELITPVNKVSEYDKVKATFDWEIQDEVELSQGEFNQYVLDEFSFAIQARYSNSVYSKTKSR